MGRKVKMFEEDRQKAIVRSKKQLLAAFNMARDFDGITDITFIHKTGKTSYVLGPLSNYELNTYNIQIQKAKGKIRRLPAKYFLDKGGK